MRERDRLACFIVLSFSFCDNDDDSNVDCNANWSSPVVASYNEGPPISGQHVGLCGPVGKQCNLTLRY